MSNNDTTRLVTRRRLLTAAVGTTAVGAGCIGGGDDSGDDGTSPTQDSSDPTDGTSGDTETDGPPAPDGSRNTGSVTGIEEAYTLAGVSPLGVDGDRLIARTSVDESPGLAGFNYLTGERAWSRSVDSYETPALGLQNIQIGYGRIYAIGSESDEDNYINVIDTATGDLLGTQEFDGDNPRRLVPLNGGAFFMTGINREYTAFYVNGDTAEREPAFSPSDVWDVVQENPLSNPRVLHQLTGGGMYAGGGRKLPGNEFQYGNTEPGQEIAVLGPGNSSSVARASSEQTIFGSRVDGYSGDPPAQARSREDGTILWERSDNYYIPPYGYGGETLAYLGADEGERVIGVDPSNGDIRWERPDFDLPTGGLNNNVTAPYAVTDRALIVGTGAGVELLSLGDGTTVASIEDGSFSPLIATQSRIITTGTVATEGGNRNGLVVYEY